MQEQPSHRFGPETDDTIERAILGLLLIRDRQVWAVEELVLEIDDRLATVDALRRLRGAGLVHSLGGEFVMASRAAVRMVEVWE